MCVPSFMAIHQIIVELFHLKITNVDLMVTLDKITKVSKCRGSKLKYFILIRPIVVVIFQSRQRSWTGLTCPELCRN